MKKNTGSNALERARRQRWATPWWLVRGVEALSGTVVGLDVCAEEWSAKASKFYTQQDDALSDSVLWVETVDIWEAPVGRSDPLANWLNPPFNNIQPFVAKAIQTAKSYGVITWMIAPQRSESLWTAWLLDYQSAWETNITGKRISFMPPLDKFWSCRDCGELELSTEGCEVGMTGWHHECGSPAIVTVVKSTTAQGSVTIWQIGGERALLPRRVNYATLKARGEVAA